MLTKNEFNLLLHFVSPSKQERIKQFYLEKDAHNCLLGDLLVRHEICTLTGLQNYQLEFSYNAHGKPFLVNYPDIYFNISHTGYYIACAINDEPIGIDVELIKKSDVKIANRFFTSDEVTYVMDENQDYRFFEIWTKKESRVKMEGVGLLKPLSSFSVLEPSEISNIYYQKIFCDNIAICHVCSSKHINYKVNIMNVHDFMLTHIPRLI